MTLRGTAAAEVARAQAAVAAFIAARGAGPRSVARAELMVEEVALNALRHGRAPGTEPQLDIAATYVDGRCVLEFEDGGTPFDPTAAPLPEQAAGLAQARIGGLGITLIRRTAQDVAYERTADGRNRLRVVMPPEGASIG